jgi:hypothetical protein
MKKFLVFVFNYLLAVLFAIFYYTLAAGGTFVVGVKDGFRRNNGLD